MTKYLIPFSAKLDGIENFLKLAEIFHFSAEMLYAVSGDGFQECDRMGHLPREVYDNNFIPTIYLYRHSIELIMKALLEETTEEIKPGSVFEKHDLRFLWDSCIKAIKSEFPSINLDEIENDLTWLKQKGVSDDQLYRYPYTRNGTHLKDQAPIEPDCVETMIRLYFKIYDIILLIKESKHKK